MSASAASVTVDDQPLQADQLGLRTVGQVLAHLQRSNRLVVYVLIDGQEPDLKQLGAIRKSPLLGHTIYIETTEPKQMALDLLAQVEAQLHQADSAKAEAADLLQKNQHVKAMEKLAGCITIWQAAQQSLVGTAQLLKLDLNCIVAGDQPLPRLLEEFTTQLQQIKSALEDRDFVTLSDLLLYETEQTNARWTQAIQALRTMIL